MGAPESPNEDTNDVGSEFSWGVLGAACRMRRMDRFIAAIDMVGGVNAVHHGVMSPLLMAIAAYFTEGIKYLLDNGADMFQEFTSFTGTITPVEFALRHDPIVVQALLDGGLNPNYTINGEPMMALAFRIGRFGTGGLLLSNGADPGFMDNNLPTIIVCAFIGASKFNDVSPLEILHDYGIDFNAITVEGIPLFEELKTRMVFPEVVHEFMASIIPDTAAVDQ